MTDPLTVQSTQAAAAVRGNSGADTGSALSAVTSDFETFLKMLSAQAKYQDPLEPIDSTEYAAQLAQFSMVEQQVQTNDILAALVSDMGRSGLTSLGGWIGMQVRSPAQVNFAGEPVTLTPDLAPGALDGVLVVSSGTGQTVRRVEFSSTDASVTWDGLMQDGTNAPFGSYSFQVESWREGSRIDTAPAQQYDRVREAQITADGATSLVLEDGRMISAEAVTALRSG